ncbi:MAG: aromatic ring-hydroxylating oxygenase subunit alpha [Ktedonobacterales bacterium]
MRGDDVDVLGGARLARSLDQGATLPAQWYTSDAVFERERDHVFRRCWQYVGLTEQLARPGDFFTAQLGEVPIVLTRAEDGQIRAFANVCRHRGALVVREECGNRKTLQCHYHAWTYNLDGSLRAAPAAKEEASFDERAFRLIPMQVETWGPFIFVNPDREAGPLRHHSETASVAR